MCVLAELPWADRTYVGRMVVPAALATPFLQTMCAKVQQRKQTTKPGIWPAVQRLSEDFGERRGYHTSGCCWEQLVIDQQVLHLALSSAWKRLAFPGADGIMKRPSLLSAPGRGLCWPRGCSARCPLGPVSLTSSGQRSCVWEAESLEQMSLPLLQRHLILGN